MNPNNYTTFEQSKRLKELGVKQEISDCVWIRIWIGEERWLLVPRMGCNLIHNEYFMESNDGEYNEILEWYAAFNSQEIELDESNFEDEKGLHWYADEKSYVLALSRICHAQARADAKIWELENKK
jgi:hypothetical protein